MIKRFYDNLEDYFTPNRAVILFGPRQIGKTTLLNNFLARTNLKYRLDSGEDINIKKILSSQDFRLIDEYVAKADLIAIDEAQQIPNIGMGLKIIVDHHSDKKVIATGSSSFDLAKQVGEPLTGRKWDLTLYPVSQIELSADMNRYDLKQRLEEYLIFGGYPEIITADNRSDKIAILENIAGSYLFKDILEFDAIRGSNLILSLVRLLAFQVGHEVSLNELANQLDMNVRTVERYLDLLEKTFVVCRVGAYSRNLRSEVRSKQKYYFFDNGIRNAVIGQFNSLDSRNDVGQLWENFIFTERMKKRSYHRIHGRTYFWRTYDQHEIDFVEERDGKLYGFECKWSEKREVKAPKEWLSTYPEAEFQVVTPANYLDYIT